MTEQRQKIALGALLLIWVAVAVWAWSQFQKRPRAVATAPQTDSEIAFFLQDIGSVDLHLEWLETDEPVGAPARDLFSSAPISSAGGPAGGPGAADPGAESLQQVVAPVQLQPAIAAELRYMGHVETAEGTLALLREGSQMYLAREGNRVGPGYLVSIVDESFVEIEFKGTRRRLPVSRQGGDTNGRRP